VTSLSISEIFSDVDESSLTDPSTVSVRRLLLDLKNYCLGDYVDFQDDLPDPDALPE